MTQPKRPSPTTRPRVSRRANVRRVVRPKAQWSDLRLPAAATKVLRQAVAQAKTGAAAGGMTLFAGEDRAGRTLAAAVAANELGRPLLRVDLTAVVRKYIGETEKNLGQVFAAAGKASAVLFFDEADALFGKRSDVKDSHDRYANLEVNYLLQRMEAYQGLVILASNMKSSLDPAFLRRLRYVVAFPKPPKRPG